MRGKDDVALDVERAYSISVIGKHVYLCSNTSGLSAVDSIEPVEVRDWGDFSFWCFENLSLSLLIIPVSKTHTS